MGRRFLQKAIYAEIESYLRDLAFQYHHQTIFEVLKRYEYSSQFGENVVPMPLHSVSVDDLRIVARKIENLLGFMIEKYGSEYNELILQAFQNFTSTTYPLTIPLSG